MSEFAEAEETLQLAGKLQRRVRGQRCRQAQQKHHHDTAGATRELLEMSPWIFVRKFWEKIYKMI